MNLYWVRTISTTTALKGGRSIAFDGERAISSARSSGKVYVWNLSKPKRPTILGSVSIETPNHVTMDNQYGYVTQREGGSVLHAVDLYTMEIVSSVDISEFPYTYGVDVDPEQGIGVVADRSGKIATIDITEPTSMGVLDILSIPEFEGATQLQLIDGYILVGGKDSSSLVIVDCSDPSNLHIKTSVTNDRLVLVDGFCYQDGFLYTAAGSRWGTDLKYDDVDWQLNVIDLTDPENPEFVGQLVTDELGECFGLERRGSFLFASSISNRQVVVIDVSDESNPVVEDIGKGLEFYGIHWLDIADSIGVSVSTNGRLTVFDADY